MTIGIRREGELPFDARDAQRPWPTGSRPSICLPYRQDQARRRDRDRFARSNCTFF